MKKALWKDFLREIRISFARFISILVIVFIGVAFFAGVKATATDMKHSVDLYYDEYNMMDIRVLSTLGITEEDIDAIKQLESIEKVQPGYFCDVAVTIQSTEFIYKVHSLSSDNDDNNLNRIRITEGRYPENSGECIIEDSSIIELGLGIGDTIKVASGTDKDIKEDTLVTDEFVIVGKAITPYYLSYEKGTSDIGSGKANFFMMILDKDFKIPVYTEALITIKNAKNLNCYTSQYKKLISKSVVPLENLGIDQTELRINSIREEAYAELDKAKKKYNEEKERYDKEIGEAEEELNKAQMELVEGQATLDSNKENFDLYYDKASKQISEGRRDLAKAEADYNKALADYNNTMATYGDDLKKLDDTTKTINENRRKAQEQIDSLNEQLNDPNLSDEDRARIEELIGFYEEYIGIIDEQIDTVNGLNNLSQQQVKNAKAQLDSAKSELDRQKKELNNQSYKLRKSKEEADAEFVAGQAEIDEGWIEYNKAKEEYLAKKLEGETKLEEARNEILQAEKEIEKLAKPQWYVLDRNSHHSFVDYEKTADRIDAIAKIFPAFFFLVASLVCLTTMTRMIDEQRGNIGTYKALGYNNRSIALKYILYAAIASILGGVLGLWLGLKIFPKVIYNSWSMMYTLPEFQTVLQVPLMIISVLIGILVTTLTAVISCNKSLKETPSLLMRPKAPKPGKKVFLERVKFIWSRLSFSHKVTVRNLFRYKKRFLMTIIGIIGCCALLLAGFGLSDSISQIVDKQYKQIFKYHLNMRYASYADEDSKLNVMNMLDADENVMSYLKSTRLNASIRSTKEDISVSLVVPDNAEEFKDYTKLRQRVSQTPIEMGDKGIVINEKLAKELDVGIGDSVEITNGSGMRKKAIISAITENYVFHYAYMTKNYFREIFLVNPEVNSLMIKLKATGAEAESRLGSKLIGDESVASIEYYSAAISTFSDTVKILNSIVIVIIISAGLLAFVVLYNLTNINICERIREIATLKVLGFYNKEVSAYVYRENIILSIIGAIIGLFGGIVLHKFIMISIEQDGVMFGNHINWISFLYAFIITLGFVILVNIFMYRRLKNIPMVESLKSVE